jgi:hypothetical protein
MAGKIFGEGEDSWGYKFKPSQFTLNDGHMNELFLESVEIGKQISDFMENPPVDPLVFNALKNGFMKDLQRLEQRTEILELRLKLDSIKR